MSRFSKSARPGAAAGRKGRPTGRPDGSESSSMPAACPNWTPRRRPDARTPTSDTPPCRGPRLAGTTSVDSRLVSRPPSPPPFASCNRIERRYSGLIVPRDSETETTLTRDTTRSPKRSFSGESRAPQFLAFFPASVKDTFDVSLALKSFHGSVFHSCASLCKGAARRGNFLASDTVVYTHIVKSTIAAL